MIVRLLWTFYSLLIFLNDNNFLMAPDIQNNFILQKNYSLYNYSKLL